LPGTDSVSLPKRPTISAVTDERPAAPERATFWARTMLVQSIWELAATLEILELGQPPRRFEARR
jgi:hypothetical protein